MEQKEKKSASSWDIRKKTGVAVAAAVIIYALIAVFFHFHYFPGTEINGYSCGFRSVGKVKVVDEKSYYFVWNYREVEKIFLKNCDIFFLEKGRVN